MAQNACRVKRKCRTAAPARISTAGRMVNFILNNFRGSARYRLRGTGIWCLLRCHSLTSFYLLFKGQTSNAGKPTLALAC
ncbi:hypothetical protein KCP74_22620 [Salmonella enterica subsp. enterica]|nr:hypothetical protein KCP74_22620 [Salmonella enterica subsp. enterica]